MTTPQRPLPPLLLLLFATTSVHADEAATVPKREAMDFLQDWVKAQNEGDFVRYAALYAPDFQGVRRTGKSVGRMNRDQWLEDRERMFKNPMQVSTDYSQATSEPGQASISFVQQWSSGKFADVGIKKMSVRRGPEGKLGIASEEMKCSRLVRRNGRAVVYAKTEDRAEALSAYPSADVQPLPADKDADCSADGLHVWQFQVVARTSYAGEGGPYDVVVWHEEENPKAQTNYDHYNGGGTMVLRNGKQIWKSEESGCEAAAMFAVPGGAVLPLTCSEAEHGEFSSVLQVYRLTENRVSKLATIPVEANNSGDTDTYAYKASIEYRDVDGNGFTDIVVTPTKRRHVGREYPKKARIINF